MNLSLVFRFLITFVITFSSYSLSQNFYRSVVDVDSFTYVTMNDKILILKRDQMNELQFVNSIPFNTTHRSDKFNYLLPFQDYLLASSLDTIYLFSITDRINPIVINKIEFTGILRFERFGPFLFFYTRMAKHLVSIENSNFVFKEIISDYDINGISINPYCILNSFAHRYPYYYKIDYDPSLEIVKYNYEENHFDTVYSILAHYDPIYDINSAWQGVLSNSYSVLAFDEYWDPGWAQWCTFIDKFDISNDTLVNRSNYCSGECDSYLNYIPAFGWSYNDKFGVKYGPYYIYKLFSTSNQYDNYYSTNIEASILTNPWVIDSSIYRIGANDFYYLFSEIGNNLTFHKFLLPVSVENENNSVPVAMELEQNYPNPFNPETKIKFTLHKSSQFRLNVYDILGSRVSTIVNEYKNSGTYETTFDGSDLPSGMYFYNLVSENNSITKKMMLIK